MTRVLKRSGNYILFDTTQRYHMISLDDRHFFVWRGPERLELSDRGHEASEVLHQGMYLLFDSIDESLDGSVVTHLACQEGARYRVYILPQGLPTVENRIVDIRESTEMPTRTMLAV